MYIYVIYAMRLRVNGEYMKIVLQLKIFYCLDMRLQPPAMHKIMRYTV